jgi:hypothetical protein
MRSKTEWVIEEYTDKKGTKKNKPVRVGLAPVQGKDIEYEFDLLGEISPTHHLTFEKDRTGKFQDKVIEKPDHTLGEQLISWLNEGDDPEKEKNELRNNIAELCKDTTITKEERDRVTTMLKNSPNIQTLEKTKDTLNKWIKERK